MEIERRFLVIGEQWRHHCLWQARLRQGYLSGQQDGLTVRVRTSEPLSHSDQSSPATATDPAPAAPPPLSGSDPHRSAPAGAPAALQAIVGPQPQAWLTLKAPAPCRGQPAAGSSSGASAVEAPLPTALALTRLEFEYDIPLADAQALLALTGHQVVKQRFGLDLPGGDWVLDRFEAANAPLVVAEVELASADQAVTVPAWCGRELTGLPQLSNAALALRPLAQWSQPERQALLGAAGFSAADAWDPFPPESSS
ncbi:MAG: hypothetical protein VKJ44_08310 [Synechococcus sp.]|nr:hypothetical protein [Synechococcus sp.]